MYQERKKTVKTWRNKEKEFLFDNYHKLPLSDICKKLGRNERSVKLFIHRHRFDIRLLKDSLLLRILKLKFGDPRLFNPTREFYSAIKMSQKRFSSILYTDTVMKDEECKRIVDFFAIPYEDVQEERQTELFPELK